ncbi:very-long-chain 3-oxoacyl-CoA reductase 1-like [Cornus florida]|uniref:very-long-chain 3-oxoacyl-CoA reductase 1-like n=1 Tax=Cornus florida TaxID=4283 RepID=UPI0028A23146|nr:very-long-chain 3-oxoacyl-CoA reductase 1-like [Cornus florida]
MEFHYLILLATATLGLISLCKSIVNIFIWVWVIFLRPPKNLKQYGSWALVTGSTDGIGKSVSFELASKGLNLVLVGRNPSKLETTSNEIIEKYGTQISIKTIVIDFAKLRGEEVARSIQEGIEGLDLGILINNVGLAYPYARFFHEVDLEMIESVIRVNIEGTTWVTRAVLPCMLKKKRGAIVNIGSGSSVAVSSYPLYTVYAATKAYVAMFSKCISLEYKKHGIDIQCQIPLLVATKMASIKRSSFFIPSPETYSKASLHVIGSDQHLCMPYWPHSLQWSLMQALPDALLDWCLFRYFLGMRKRGLQKDSMNTKVKQQKKQ